MLKQRPQQQNQPVQEAGQKKKKKKKVQRQLAPIQQVLTPPVPLTSMADGYANSAMLVQQSHPLSPEATDLEVRNTIMESCFGCLPRHEFCTRRIFLSVK